MTLKRLIPIFCAFLLLACGTSKEPTRSEGADKSGDAPDPYERDFRPAEHDPATHVLLGEEPDTSQQLGTVQPDATPPQSMALVGGFRVQLLSSSEIDEAYTKKAEAETLFPREWIYLVYDPPTYKIRVGNFLARFEADRFLKLATEKGYRDAWIVPERVFRHPPPPPTPQNNDQSNRK